MSYYTLCYELTHCAAHKAVRTVYHFISLSGDRTRRFGGRLMHLALTVINFCLTAPPRDPFPPTCLSKVLQFLKHNGFKHHGSFIIIIISRRHKWCDFLSLTCKKVKSRKTCSVKKSLSGDILKHLTL